MERRTLNYILVSLLTLFLVFTFLHIGNKCSFRTYGSLMIWINLGILFLLGIFSYRGILVFPESKFSVVVFIISLLPVLLPLAYLIIKSSPNGFFLFISLGSFLLFLISIISLHYYNSSMKAAYTFRIFGFITLIVSLVLSYLVFTMALICMRSYI